MPRAAFTLSTAQQRLDEKFPEKGFKLLEFSGSKKPCVISCPIHGDVHVSVFNNILFSRCGCPKCGADVARATVQREGKQVSRRLKATWSLSRRLTNLPIESMTDKQLGKELRTLLLQYKSKQN